LDSTPNDNQKGFNTREMSSQAYYYAKFVICQNMVSRALFIRENTWEKGKNNS